MNILELTKQRGLSGFVASAMGVSTRYFLARARATEKGEMHYQYKPFTDDELISICGHVERALTADIQNIRALKNPLSTKAPKGPNVSQLYPAKIKHN